MSAPSSSPPPYSLTPPDVHPLATTNATVAKRAASSPHLRLPNSPPLGPPFSSHSRQAFSEHARAWPPRVIPTSSEEESGAETDDGVVFRSTSFADTLRHRLLGKGKGRAYHEHWSRPITTAPGAPCAGETETEGEDSVSTCQLSLCAAVCPYCELPLQPRNLPTARITRSALSEQIPLPPSTAWIVPLLFQLFRLLAIVPAVFGTLWNLYRVFRPPDERAEWRVDYSVSVLWVRSQVLLNVFKPCSFIRQSVLTGWQCLQLTTGLLKRWRVYYSPFATLIRLLALQGTLPPVHRDTRTTH